jgi:hypothetical protein
MLYWMVFHISKISDFVKTFSPLSYKITQENAVDLHSPLSLRMMARGKLTGPVEHMNLYCCIT